MQGGIVLCCTPSDWPRWAGCSGCNCCPLQENMILKSMWWDQTHKLCRIFVSDNAPEGVPKFSLCASTELFSKQVAFQKCCASTTPLPQLCQHPSCWTGMNLAGVRTQTHSAEHHPSQAWDLLLSWHQWDVHPLRVKVGLNLCLCLLLDALPVVATWLTGILDIGNDLQKSLEFSYSMEKYSFSRK